MRIRFFALAALALLLGACTQDEAGFLPEGAEGTSIIFTATGLNPAATATAGTRAPVDGNWEGVQSVAVLMDGTVKVYDVTPSTADHTSATLTSTDPYYWTNHNNITVTAWWPYTAGETTPPAVKVKANQSTQKDFEGSDLIVADGQTVTYGSPTLRFTHRTARVTIVLTDYTEGLASVKLTGLSTEGDNPDIITPYDKGSNTYTAIVAPQSVAAGTTFIVCTFTNGKTLVYKMKNATDWQAGGEYTYTVSLAAARGYTIESNGSYTVTSADGLMNIAKLVNGARTRQNSCPAYARRCRTHRRRCRDIFRGRASRALPYTYSRSWSSTACPFLRRRSGSRRTARTRWSWDAFRRTDAAACRR